MIHMSSTESEQSPGQPPPVHRSANSDAVTVLATPGGNTCRGAERLGEWTYRESGRLSKRLRASRSRLLRRRSEEHTSELQSQLHLVCRLLLEKTKPHR